MHAGQPSYRIDADLLIPGRGDPVRSATLVTTGGRIQYAGPTADAPHIDDTPVISAPVVMPGLWECHGHLGGLPPTDTFSFARFVTEPMALRAARCVRDIQAALAAGITSIREVGGLGVYLAAAIEEGTLDGPSIYAAGAVLSTTGGHGDVHDLPLPWLTDFGHAGGEFRQCDGPADCAKAAREQLRKGAKLLKVCASGGVLSVVDDPIHQQFTGTELRAIVEVATMADRIVAAHCHGKPGIMAAIEAGAHTIEHGTYLDDEVAEAMRETGAILVPTRSIIEVLLAEPNKPPHLRRKIEQVANRHAEAVHIAHDHGVTIAAGADVVVSNPHASYAWGNGNTELELLVRLGLTPLEAIEAATANGPLTVGRQAPRSGLLAADYDADFITLDRDPVADISAIVDPANITGVWKNGVRVR